jgi:hypothetical protein
MGPGDFDRDVVVDGIAGSQLSESAPAPAVQISRLKKETGVIVPAGHTFEEVGFTGAG